MRPEKRPQARTARLPRRGSDRLEDVAAWLLMVVGLLIVVLAGSIGIGIHGALTEQVRQQQTERIQVSATALQDALFVGDSPGANAPRVLVEASWTGPDGSPRTGSALVPPMTRAGQQVTVWMDREGQPLDEPAGPVATVIAATACALGVVLAGGVALTLVWVGVRHGIGVLNDRQWEREWALIGPQWTGHGGDHRRDVTGGRPTD